jgi:hypothetical protein
LRDAYAMLCHSVGLRYPVWAYQSLCLSSVSSTLLFYLLEQLKQTRGMKIQVVIVVSSDGNLVLVDPFDVNIESGKYGIESLKKQADLILNKDSSLIALLEEKRKSSTSNYLVKTTSLTFDFVKGLFIYNLVKELIIYKVPSVQIRDSLLSEFINLSEWKLAKQQSIDHILCRFTYRKTK